jgi:biopolymer transport protein ExbD
MRRKRSLPSEEEPEDPLINLTPLIDVVFVVLITFMVVAPVLDIDRIELASSSASHAKQEPSATPFSITVRENNSIWVEGEAIALADLTIWLQKKRRLNPLSIPKLIQDQRAQFGTYQAVKNLCEEVGFQEMELVLRP